MQLCPYVGVTSNYVSPYEASIKISATTCSLILISVISSYYISTICGAIERVGSFDGIEDSCWKVKFLVLRMEI